MFLLVGDSVPGTSIVGLEWNVHLLRRFSVPLTVLQVHWYEFICRQKMGNLSVKKIADLELSGESTLCTNRGPGHVCVSVCVCLYESSMARYHPLNLIPQRMCSCWGSWTGSVLCAVHLSLWEFI